MSTPPLVFQDVINILNTAVNRPDIAATSNGYMDFINRAVRDIAALHSFDQMSVTTTVTLASGSGTASMPANFKDLQPGRYPAYVTAGAPYNYTSQPVPVYRKEEVSRIQQSFLPNPSLIYTSDNNGFQLGFLPPVTASANWSIFLYYFAYPDVVTDPTIGTQLLTFYPDLVISRTLQLVFESINDKISEMHAQNFKEQMAEFTEVDMAITNPQTSN